MTVTCATADGRASGARLVRGRLRRRRAATTCGGARASPSTGETFDDHFLICDIRTDLPGWETERRFYFDPEWNPGRQVLIHPCPDSTFRIDWQVPPDFDLAAEEASGGAGPADPAGHRRPRRTRSCGSRSTASTPGSSTGCGSAGCCWPATRRTSCRPFGARGLNSGVLDAENAAWKIAFVLRGWAPESLLDSYHDERHAAALENLDGHRRRPCASSCRGTERGGPPPARRPGARGHRPAARGRRSTPAGWPSRSGTSTPR